MNLRPIKLLFKKQTKSHKVSLPAMFPYTVFGSEYHATSSVVAMVVIFIEEVTSRMARIICRVPEKETTVILNSHLNFKFINNQTVQMSHA